MTPTLALIRLVSQAAADLGMGEHSYIVGGAPRDFVLGHEVKDIDIVVEPLNGKDAQTLGQKVAEVLGLTCHPDHYGVVHVGPVMESFPYLGTDLIGQKVEIVTSRKEKYDRTRGKDSHKPSEVAVGTIMEDLLRRDFTINTLMWRLEDLKTGPENAKVIDLLGRGLKDLESGTIVTPLDPHETFDDDPSRMLRAVRFSVKYNFRICRSAEGAIKDRAAEILRLPYEAIDPLFFDKILTMDADKVRVAITLMDHYGLLTPVTTLIPSSRMRRAIQERVKDIRLLLFLASWKMSVGYKFSPKQLERLRDIEAGASDEYLNEVFQRFLKPLDTERFIANTGASGAMIGCAVEEARDLVLLEVPPERVQEIIEAKAHSYFIA